MARADLLKKLFRSFQMRDDSVFREAAEEIINEERKKHHNVLATELERILNNNRTNTRFGPELVSIDPPPKDHDRRTPLLEIRRPARYLDDLVFEKVVRNSLDRALLEFGAWDVLEANGLPPMRRILFCGPSGCGKTATGEAFAAELGLPLLYIRFDAVVSSLLGETSANLRKVFDYARRGQWVMLFDEFDAIGRSRDDVTEHGEIKRVVNSFLQIVDSFDGRSLIIAATNFEQALDPAVWRRFDEVIRLERPNDDNLMILLRKRLKPLRFDDVHVMDLVKQLSGSTYADAERICFDIRKSCAMRGEQQVRPEDITEAIARESYRQSVLLKASSPGVPTIEKE